MKVVYNKRRELRIFGLKICEWRENYCERSKEDDGDEDRDFYIDLNSRFLGD